MVVVEYDGSIAILTSTRTEYKASLPRPSYISLSGKQEFLKRDTPCRDLQKALYFRRYAAIDPDPGALKMLGLSR